MLTNLTHVSTHHCFSIRLRRGKMQGNVMHQATQHKKTMSGTVRTLVLTRCNEDIPHEPQGWDDVEEEVEANILKPNW